MQLDHDDDGAWTARCRGELDVAAHEHLVGAIRLCLDANPASIVVDCADVSFIDSEGIRALLRAARDAHDAGVGYRLEISDQVRDSLSRAGILERLLTTPLAEPAGP